MLAVGSRKKLSPLPELLRKVEGGPRALISYGEGGLGDSPLLWGWGGAHHSIFQLLASFLSPLIPPPPPTDWCKFPASAAVVGRGVSSNQWQEEAVVGEMAAVAEVGEQWLK